MKIFYCLLLLLLATFMLNIGLKVLLKRKPVSIHTIWFFVVIAIAFSPMAVSSLIALAREGLTPKALILLFNPLMYVVLVLMMWFVMKGYCFIGVTEDSIREGLHAALNKLNIKFEETLSCIKLTGLDSELQVCIQPWLGNAVIKSKGKKGKKLIKNVVDEMRVFFQNTELKINVIIPVFYVITGTLMVVCMVVLLIL